MAFIYEHSMPRVPSQGVGELGVGAEAGAVVEELVPWQCFSEGHRRQIKF